VFIWFSKEEYGSDRMMNICQPKEEEHVKQVVHEKLHTFSLEENVQCSWQEWHYLETNLLWSAWKDESKSSLKEDFYL